MRKAGRVVILFLLSLFSTAVLTAAAALLAAVSLAATALIVPGTGTPNANTVGNYKENFRDYYMQKPCSAMDSTNGCDTLTGVNYPATFWPIPLPDWCPNLSCDTFNVSVAKGVQNLKTVVDGTSGSFLIAGYSQGARVASIAKMRYLNGDWVGQTPDAFVYIGNPNRPNGGLLSRLGFIPYIPILNITTGQPTPTGGTPLFPDGIPTEDWAIRWEGIADWPTFMLNPLAVVNSILGFGYDHGSYLAINQDSDPGETPAGYTVEEWRDITTNPQNHPQIVDIQKYGDTTYYTITPKVLPLVRPLHLIPLIGKPIADLIEPVLRVLIEETGYARGIPFGAPIGTGFIPIFNPITLFLKLIPAVLVGINNFFANFGLTKEIPLSPTTAVTPAPSPPTVEQQDELQDNPDDLSGARLARVEDNGDVDEQQGDGEMQMLAAQTEAITEETEGDLMQTEGITEGTEETQPLGAADNEETGGTVEETGGTVEETEPEQPDETEPEQVEAVRNEDPEENTAPNRVDANGGSVSLNFSPNQRNEGDNDGDSKDTEETDPADDPEPAAGAEGGDGGDGGDGGEGSDDSGQAAA